MARRSGIVLAGGRSRRMGTAKAALEWHGSTLLARVTGIVARGAAGPVVVVRAPGQPLPALPRGVEVVEDAREGAGPLVGLLAGLEALEGRADVAFASSTDVPLLHPAFVRRVLDLLDDATDAVVPHVDGHRQPLTAAYRTTLRPLVADLVAADRLKPAGLFAECRVRWADADDLLRDARLAGVDPGLASVRNLNTPEDYAAARALPAPEVRVERYGTLRPPGDRRAVVVRAATLGAACDGVGVALDGHVVAAINGDQMTADADAPLAAGDTVGLMTADAGG